MRPVLDEALREWDPRNVRVRQDEFGDMRLEVQTRDGEWAFYERVHPARPFPLTAPNEFISFFDEHENFLGLVRDLRRLDRDAQKLIEEVMDRRYFMPRIRRIVSLEIRGGVTSWVVETDRGERTFDVRDRDDLRPLPPYRLVIGDVDGNRYEIPDYTALDEDSRYLLEPLLE